MTDKITIQWLSADGMVRGEADGEQSATLRPAEYAPGDRLVFSGARYLWVRVAEGVKESMVFLPECRFTYPIPQDEQAIQGFAPGTFAGAQTVTARRAERSEISAYRNLALNPADRRLAEEVVDPDAPEWSNPTNSEAVAGRLVECFPHAYANRVTRNEGCFYARNAIDGLSNKGGHGVYPFHSWGGAVHKDLSLTVYFGRAVTVDKIILHLRSDYGLNDKGQEHDTYWNVAILEFSDGSEVEIHPEKTGDPQEFPFAPRETTFLKFKRMDPVQVETSLNFAALNEIEVWGTDSNSL